MTRGVGNESILAPCSCISIRTHRNGAGAEDRPTAIRVAPFQSTQQGHMLHLKIQAALFRNIPLQDSSGRPPKLLCLGLA